jgi:hypothetical protein
MVSPLVNPIVGPQPSDHHERKVAQWCDEGPDLTFGVHVGPNGVATGSMGPARRRNRAAILDERREVVG